MTTTATRQFQDTRVDVKVVLTALWTAMLFVFAYVDIFGFYRDDVLKAALHGKVAGTAVHINQHFLLFTLSYILLPALMVVLCLVLRPRANRILNVSVAVVYLISIVVTCIGEKHVYYLLGSAIEVILLLAIVRSAWKWPAVFSTGSLPR